MGLVHESGLLLGQSCSLLHVLLLQVGVVLLVDRVLAELGAAHRRDSHVDISVKLVRLDAIHGLGTVL